MVEKTQESSGDDNAGKKRNENTKEEGQGEAADGTGGVQERPIERVKENQTGDNGGQISVLDRVPGPDKTQLETDRPGTPGPDFFPITLENEDVAVDGHTDRKQETGDAGESQSDGNKAVKGSGNQTVDQKTNNGDNPEPAIIENHKDGSDSQTDSAGEDALADGVFAEGGRNDFLGKNLDRHRQGAGIELGG